MPLRVRREMVKAFAKVGGRILMDVRTGAPSKTGKLRRSVRLRVSERADKSGVWMRVSVGEWYGRLLEEGVDSQADDYRVWNERKSGAAGRLGGMRRRFRQKKRTMHLRPRPFFAPAWQRSQARLLEAAEGALRQAVEGA
jgi:hypothetical protein